MTDLKPSTKRRKKLHRNFGSENVTFWNLPDAIHISLLSGISNIAKDVETSFSNLEQICLEKDIVLERASCTVFMDSDVSNSAKKLLKNSLDGYQKREASGIIGLITFGDISDDISDEKNDTDQRKLLVLVVVEEENESEIVWKETNGGATTEVRITAEKLPALVHDIYFDVLIANSFPIRRSFKKFAPEIIFQNKLKFCRDNKLNSYFGKSGEKAGYTSIVSCFRNSDRINDIDWKKAIMSWENFVNDFGEDLEACTNEELTYQIRRKHLKGGSLSPTKLNKEISELTPFKAYYLLLTEKRPKKETVRYKVRTALGKPNWHQNMWHIVRADEIARFEKYLRVGYLSAYKFIR